MKFSVKDAVEKWYSVRTFDIKSVEKEVREKILLYAEESLSVEEAGDCQFPLEMLRLVPSVATWVRE